MDENYLQVDIFEKDVRRLSQLYENITKFRILGGEPLLHPSLSKFVDIVRKYFPYSDIRVVTNGLLLISKNIDGNLFDSMRKCGALFDISMYPPTCKNWFKIKKVLREENIVYSTMEPINVFSRRASLKKRGTAETFYKCRVGCTSLRRGMITRCGVGRGIYILAKHFDKEVEESIKNSGYYDIHDKEIDGWKMNNLLWKTPFSACEYCVPGLTNSAEEAMLGDENARFPWQAGGVPKLEDWLYVDDKK